MAEPTGTPSTPRLPFNPPPASPAVRTGGPGKPLVIGCLILLVLVGAGLIGALYYVGQHYDQLFAWSLARIRDGIVTRLPPDLPADARQRLDAAFAGAQSAAGSIRGNPAAAQKLQSAMLELAGQAEGKEPLTQKQVEEITATLEKIAAVGKPGSGG
jgi:hypothetical protein